MSFDFIQECQKKIHELNVNWEVKGLIDTNRKVYSLGSDSKILGRIFELVAAPIITEVAEEHGLTVVIPEKQNSYPDFTIQNEDGSFRIAVDIKSTYRQYYNSTSIFKGYRSGEVRNFVFTLGSYASYLRNNTKNIVFNYDTYQKHYIFGFLYDRTMDGIEGQIVDVDKVDEVKSPFENVEFFIQEKYLIAGESKGSGNTENIGSYPTNDINFLKNGCGPFSVLGEETFEHYWRNYPEYRDPNPKFTNLVEYFAWLKENNIFIRDAGRRYYEWLERFDKNRFDSLTEKEISILLD
ncbi:type II restriction endonuclease [Tuberibacillus calidus]|jgi:hypothetical protein|uniref:type II restriction endonuclease n=1 Tax=Tuberibacillus calidus TaxID=340097 RepID=UPI00040828E0|nr:type II restriction endonuclease [Tuberibacillus calidus]